jgi:UDP-glucose 4-epimerase
MANVLVCGGAGYIGSHMVDHLLRCSSHKPVVFDNLSMGHRSAVPGSVPFVEADLLDKQAVLSALQKHSIDVVMHFAAYCAVGESVADPIRYYRNNVSATVSVLEAMQAAGVKTFVFSSSAATYGAPGVSPISEDIPKAPINPYGRTKLWTEEMLADCKVAWGLESTCLRYFNAAGCSLAGNLGEDHTPETHLIPLVLMVALGKRKNVSIFGDDYPTRDGSCVRDYIHVEDLARAHLMAIDRMLEGKGGSIFNLGTSSGVTVKEIVEACRKVTGHSIPAVIAPRRPGDPPELVADFSKARKILGWSPQYSSVETVVSTAWNWMKNHPDGYPD